MPERAARKCTFTKRPVSPRDRSSVVFTLGKLDESGRYTGEDVIVTACGSIRKDGSIDSLFYNEVIKDII